MQDEQLRKAQVENVRQAGIEDSSVGWLDERLRKAREKEKRNERRQIGQ